MTFLELEFRNPHGKSYYSEVLELSKTKKISFKEYPSITDTHGKILYINKVDKLNIENDQ